MKDLEILKRERLNSFKKSVLRGRLSYNKAFAVQRNT